MKTVYAYLQRGLGNQCFIYAAARALALRANAELRLNADMLHTDGYGRRFSLGPFAGVPPALPVRPLPVRKAEALRSLIVSRLGAGLTTYPNEDGRFCPLPTEWRGRLSLRNGFWQSERYFNDCCGQILRDFRLKDDSYLSADGLARRIAATENSVFLHVRTFKEVPEWKDGCHVMGRVGYYRNALRYLAERLPSATVFVFSDELDWARRNVLTDETRRGIPFEFVYDDPGSGQLRDFTLMRMCRHGIVADSTFSWFAGWLGEQERLARGESPLRLHVNRRAWNDDFWPNRWVAIDG